MPWSLSGYRPAVGADDCGAIQAPGPSTPRRIGRVGQLCELANDRRLIDIIVFGRSLFRHRSARQMGSLPTAVRLLGDARRDGFKYPSKEDQQLAEEYQPEAEDCLAPNVPSVDYLGLTINDPPPF